MDCWDINNNLTKELNELKQLFTKMKKIAHKYIMPRIQIHSIKEFNNYNEHVEECLDQIKSYFDYLRELNSCEKIIIQLIFLDETNKSLIDQIVDDLHNLLQKKNKEWCELRVNNAFQTIIPFLLSLSSEEHIDTDLLDNESTLDKQSFLNIIIDTFIGSLTDYPMDDDMVSNLYEATFFTCSKCKENKNDLPENAQILLCSECTHNYKLMHLKKTMEKKTMEPEPQIEALEA